WPGPRAVARPYSGDEARRRARRRPSDARSRGRGGAELLEPPLPVDAAGAARPAGHPPRRARLLPVGSPRRGERAPRRAGLPARAVVPVADLTGRRRLGRRRQRPPPRARRDRAELPEADRAARPPSRPPWLAHRP